MKSVTLIPRLPGWTLGLVLTTGIIYCSAAAYQRWSDDESRLAALEYRAQFLVPTRPADPPVATAQPAARPQPKDIWVAGAWETQADAYLKRHIYDPVSSATPPPRRTKGP